MQLRREGKWKWEKLVQSLYQKSKSTIQIDREDEKNRFNKKKKSEIE